MIPITNKNIKYKSKQILEFYSSNRQRWKEFYPSERRMFEKIAGKRMSLRDVLDVGCACGGLALALHEKFFLNSYTGVDINRDVIEWANKKVKLPIPHNFICADIIKLRLNRCYDTVVSLSCADWNIETRKIIDACWKRVKYGGYFVISLRITPEKGINDIKKSYQYINFSAKERNPEVANYVVFNFREALMTIKELNPQPELIGAFGYWRKPSSMAVTPFKKLIFAVFYIRKGMENSHQKIRAEFSLPKDIIYRDRIKV